MRLLLPALFLAGLLTAPVNTLWAQTNAAEIEFWQSVKASNAPAELEAYLTAYPKGKFTPLAKIRLKNIRSTQQPGKPTTTPPKTATRKPAKSNEAAFKPIEKTASVTIGARPNDPSRGIIGIRIRNFPFTVAAAFKIQKTAAVFVASVTKDSPADKAKIAPGDIILSIDGEATETIESLLQKIASRSPGETLSVTLVKLAETPADLPKVFQRGVAEDSDGSLTGFFAWMLMNGVGTAVPKDTAEAFKWYRKAAEKGNMFSMNKLGALYENGVYVAQDSGQAAKWYRKAAEKGHAPAMFNLGFLLETGRGVAQNKTEAVKWYRKAEAKGEDGAKTRLKLLGAGQGGVRRGTTKRSGASALGDLKDLDKLD